MEPIAQQKGKILVNPNFNVIKINNTTAVNMPFFNPLFLSNISSLSTSSMTSLTTSQAMPGHRMQSSDNQVPKIHVNPNFLQRQLYEQMLTTQKVKEKQIINSEVCNNNSNNNNNNKPLLEKKGIWAAVLPVASRKLVRSAASDVQRTVNNSTAQKKEPTTPKNHGIVKRKLVRHAPTATRVDAMPTTTSKLGTQVPSSFPIVKRFKIDKRLTLPSHTGQQKMHMRTLKKCFNSRFALANTPNQFAQKYNKVSSFPKARPRRMSAMSFNRKLELANINGVVYKLTQTKLQRKDLSIAASPSESSAKSLCKATTNIASRIQQPPNLHGRVIIVRGMKFMMNKNCNKLVRVATTTTENPKQAASTVAVPATPTSSATKVGKRIDIGGLTYVASKSQNVFVCTNNHRNLAHLHHAKHRSLWMLRERLVKSNIPCAIFQRLGKCRAHEQGKCSKMHDKKQVAICSRFLRGECVKPNCSLSHNVSLSKMPVCRFFLQGFCIKDECPYLHKKVSNKAEICLDFLRGYCKMAEQCNKRHEFLCPRIQRNEKCLMRDCLVCQSNKRKHKRSLEAKQKSKETSKPNVHDKIKEIDTKVDVTDQAAARYYSLEQVSSKEDAHNRKSNSAGTLSADSSDEGLTAPLELIVDTVRRPPLGPLPVFIPLDNSTTEPNS